MSNKYLEKIAEYTDKQHARNYMWKGIESKDLRDHETMDGYRETSKATRKNAMIGSITGALGGAVAGGLAGKHIGGIQGALVGATTGVYGGAAGGGFYGAHRGALKSVRKRIDNGTLQGVTSTVKK